MVAVPISMGVFKPRISARTFRSCALPRVDGAANPCQSPETLTSNFADPSAAGRATGKPRMRSRRSAGLVHSSFIDAIESGVESSFEPRPLRCSTPLKITRANLIPYMARYYDWPFHPSTLVLRRAVWERSGGYNPAYALADTDWFVRVAEEFSAVLLPRQPPARRHRRRADGVAAVRKVLLSPRGSS